MIVTAGAVGSPKLLLFSGIGPAAQLQGSASPPCSICPVWAPVCRTTPASIFTTSSTASTPSTATRSRSLCSSSRSSTCSSAAASCLQQPRWRRLLVERAHRAGSQHAILFRAALPGVPYRHGCSMNFYELRPRSRGSVRLSSSDPLAKPLIDPNYLRRADRSRANGRGPRGLPVHHAPAGDGEAHPPRVRARTGGRRAGGLERYARKMVDTGYHSSAPVGWESMTTR